MPWLETPGQLSLAGLTGFETVRLEDKLPIRHGGGTANLDLGAHGPNLMVGVESKLTETLAPHEPVSWRRPYLSEQMGELLGGGWAQLFEQSLAGQWQPRHLGLEQLLKHALAINSHAHARQAHLLYLYWEPENADQILELVAHRHEVQQLTERVGDATPRLHTLTYRQLLDQWSQQADPAWLAKHVAQLRERYQIEI